jgi:hypothetical protein
MRAVFVVVRQVLREDLLEVTTTEDEESVETLSAARAYESLGDRVRTRRSHGRRGRAARVLSPLVRRPAWAHLDDHGAVRQACGGIPCSLAARRARRRRRSRRRCDPRHLWVPKTPSKRLTWGFCAGGLEDMIGTGRRSGPFNPGRRVSQPGCYQVSDLR